MQPISLTDEQRAFRTVLRQFCDDKIAPLAAEVDDSGEPTYDRGVRTVFPVQRAHAVPTGAEMPIHLGTRRFYIISCLV